MEMQHYMVYYCSLLVLINGALTSKCNHTAALCEQNEESPWADTKLCMQWYVCTDEYISYYLINRQTNKPYKMTDKNIDSIKNAPFIKGSGLKVLLPGNNDTLTTKLFISAYLNTSDVNILYFDYSKLIGPTFCQSSSVMNIGDCVHKSLMQIYKYVELLTLNNTHLVGYDYGSYIAGHVGNNFDGLVYRVTVFDPAEFADSIPTDKQPYAISTKSASIVDAYHTNMGYRGTWNLVGTVDIIFNDGTFQPGCDNDTLCSHNKASEYYLMTISGHIKYKAQPCTYRLYDYLANEIDQICPPIADRISHLVGEYLSPETSGAYLVNTSWSENSQESVNSVIINISEFIEILNIDINEIFKTY